MADFKAVADAIATRFTAANVTAPSGETNVRLSTAALPDAITHEPTVLVFPPELEFSEGPSLSKVQANYPVRFYIYKVRDDNRNSTLILKWLTALYPQLQAKVHLGLAYVDNALVRSMTPGELTYHDVRHHGIELTVEVNISEGVNYVA